MNIDAIRHRTALTTGVPQDLTDQVIEAFLRELSAAFTEAVPAPPLPHAPIDTTGAFAPGAVIAEPPTPMTLPDGW